MQVHPLRMDLLCHENFADIVSDEEDEQESWKDCFPKSYCYSRPAAPVTPATCERVPLPSPVAFSYDSEFREEETEIFLDMDGLAMLECIDNYDDCSVPGETSTVSDCTEDSECLEDNPNCDVIDKFREKTLSRMVSYSPPVMTSINELICIATPYTFQECIGAMELNFAHYAHLYPRIHILLNYPRSPQRESELRLMHAQCRSRNFNLTYEFTM